MRTDALIALLARGPVPFDSGQTTRRLGSAALAGVALAAAAMVFALGPRADLAAAASLPMFWLKLALPAGVAAAAFAALARLARPGETAPTAALVLAGLLVALWAMAVAELAGAPAGARASRIAGETALPCVLSIAALSLPGFAAVVLALRGLAPTRLAPAGAAAGGLAGALAAAVYALHCHEMAVSFLAAWYVLGIALPAVAGFLLGPRLLRW